MRNRLCSSAEPTGSLENLHHSEHAPKPSPKSFLEQNICLFGPESYEPRYDYPLILWMHSCQSSEMELENVMPELSLRNYVACAPRGTVACDPEAKYFRWGQSAAATAIAEEIVFESVSLACEQFSVSPERIFLAGFGGGGTMAWRVALRYPKRFAGVVSICGDFPHHNQPLTNIASARELRTLWMYGEQAKHCGIQHVCDSLPMLHTANLNVDVRQYPCGTELLSNMLVDMNSWVMSQVTRQPAEETICHQDSFSRN